LELRLLLLDFYNFTICDLCILYYFLYFRIVIFQQYIQILLLEGNRINIFDELVFHYILLLYGFILYFS